jgi:hypothetical protein
MLRLFWFTSTFLNVLLLTWFYNNRDSKGYVYTNSRISSLDNYMIGLSVSLGVSAYMILYTFIVSLRSRVTA